ncbi:MAG: MgtC/SapB family protein [Halodesulfurarchaeum sp.]
MVAPLSDLVLTGDVAKIVLAVGLGMFLGLEREWSQKPAGIRTFALVSVLGTILTLVDVDRCAEGGCVPVMGGIGGLLVVVVAAVLAISGLREEDESLHLTTAVSLFVAYGAGVLIAMDHLLSATVVAVTSSILLVFKRELHGFAWGLTREELHSAAEFAILAFVVYPILPPGQVTVASLGIRVEPRVVWLMVVFVAGIGIVNYAVVKTYGGRAVAITGFFGGLASSTAVVGSMLDHVNREPEATDYTTAAVLMAISAMALRNLVLAMVFTDPESVLLTLALPLGVIILGGVAIGVFEAEWRQAVTVDLASPFSMRYALGFGAMFAVVTLAGTFAETRVGAAGLLLTAFVSGFVSSAGSTTSVVVLFRAGTIDAGTMTLAVLLATVASILVKLALAATSPNREFARRVLTRSAALLVAAAVTGALVAM